MGGGEGEKQDRELHIVCCHPNQCAQVVGSASNETDVCQCGLDWVQCLGQSDAEARESITGTADL